jgi:aspartokinase/homoserine dehydrogenase 1
VRLISGCGKKNEASSTPRNVGVPCLIHDNTRDSIIAFGELLSASMISFALNCDMMDARTLIRTDDVFGNANVDFEVTSALCQKAQVASYHRLVVPGFIASTKEGLTSVLGRGGSDYTATILGASIKAKKVVIWTDVTGVYSADPRLVKQVGD